MPTSFPYFGISQIRAILLSIILLLSTTTLADAAPELAGRTNMTYDPGHGTQIEYLAKEQRFAHLIGSCPQFIRLHRHLVFVTSRNGRCFKCRAT